MNTRTDLRRGALGLVAVSALAIGSINCGVVDEPTGQEALPAATGGSFAEASQPAETCVTIQRGLLGTVADSMIASNIDGAHNPDNTAGDGNFGADAVAIAGKVGNGEREALFQFSLSSIPAGATINSATLTLQARSDSHGGAGNTMSVHAVTSAWSEAGVTWNTAPTFNPTAFASDQGGPGTHTFDVSSLASGWFTGANDGVLLEQDGYYYTSFSTSEDPTLGNRPALAVCYTPSALGSCPAPPAGTNLLADGDFSTPVAEGGAAAGWTSATDCSGAGGTVSYMGGHVFIINACGQSGTDPNIRQTLTGLTIGATYTVSGAYQDYYEDTNHSALSFAVGLDCPAGVTICSSLIFQSASPGNGTPLGSGGSLGCFSTTFTATSTTHTLSFIGERNGTDDDYAVTSLSVVAGP